MRWTKVAIAVAGVLVVFFVVDSIVHVVLGLLTTLVFVAIVAGGIAVAVKVAAARRRREVSRGRKDHSDHQVADEPARHVVLSPPPMPPASAGRPQPADVEDELARLKREMGG